MPVKHKQRKNKHRRGYQAQQPPANLVKLDPDELRVNLISEIPRLRGQLRSNIQELRDLICSHSAHSVVCKVHDAFMLAKWEAGAAYGNNQKFWNLGLLLEYVHACFASTEERLDAPPLTARAFTRLSALMPAIFKTANRLIAAEAAKGLVVDGEPVSMTGTMVYADACINWLGIRKKRHMTLDVPLMRALLAPQSAILSSVFGLTADELVQGYERLLTSLVRGKADLWQGFRQFWKENAATLSYSPTDPRIAEAGERFKGITNLDTFDVQTITGWPTSLVAALTWGRGDCKKFFDGSDEEGWPTKEMPHRRRPFVQVDGKPVCFDISALKDHFYSALQRAIRAEAPKSDELWKKNQTQATEQLPRDIFASLLPGVRLLPSRYYQYVEPSGKKRVAEVDNLAVYGDVLFILESKGGNFTPSSPVEDFKSYKKALTKLVVEPAAQCHRLMERLAEVESLQFFHDDKCISPAETLSHAEFRLIVPVGLTLENFTCLAAQAGNLAHLGLPLPLKEFWSLALDDLMVLSKVFTRPAMFLHYVEQRLKCSSAQNATFIDEHDHLSMYLNFNQYALFLNQETINRVIVDSAGLDEYLLAVDNGATPGTLQQKLPKWLDAVLRALEGSSRCGWSALSAALLDFSDDGRKKVAEAVGELVACAVKTPRPRVSWFYCGDEPLGIYAQPDVVQEQFNEAILTIALERARKEGWHSVRVLAMSVSQDMQITNAWVDRVSTGTT
jgi:hypothetical protein